MLNQPSPHLLHALPGCNFPTAQVDNDLHAGLDEDMHTEFIEFL